MATAKADPLCSTNAPRASAKRSKFQGSRVPFWIPLRSSGPEFDIPPRSLVIDRFFALGWARQRSFCTGGLGNAPYARCRSTMHAKFRKRLTRISISKDICTAVRFGRIGINLLLCPQPRAFGPDRRPTTPPTGGRDHSLAGAGLECFSSGDEEFHERHLLYSPHYRIRRGSGLSHVRGPRRRVIPQRLAAAASGWRSGETALHGWLDGQSLVMGTARYGYSWLRPDWKRAPIGGLVSPSDTPAPLANSVFMHAEFGSHRLAWQAIRTP